VQDGCVVELDVRVGGELFVRDVVEFGGWCAVVGDEVVDLCGGCVVVWVGVAE